MTLAEIMCPSGRLGYPTKSTAKRAVKRIKTETRERGLTKLPSLPHPFFCNRCGQYHLMSKPLS